MDMSSKTSATPTILDIATKAISSPADLAPADVTRLGTFIVDHVDHVAMHQRMLAELEARRQPVFPHGLRSDGGSTPSQRLAPQAPALIKGSPGDDPRFCPAEPDMGTVAGADGEQAVHDEHPAGGEGDPNAGEHLTA